MEYQVPQFIEVEDKIIGPLTFRQFVYLAGGAGVCVVCFFSLPFILAVLFSILFGGFAVLLAFYKINGKPFIVIVEAAFNYLIGAKFFLWKHTDARPTPVPSAPPPVSPVSQRAAPRFSRSKLSELALSLDTSSGNAPGS